MATFGDLVSGRLRRSVIDPETGMAVVTSAPTGEVRQRADLLPIGRDDSGALVPAVPKALFDVIDAARFPGQVARGEKQVFDPTTGHVSDEALGAANGIAGLAMTGSLPFSAPKGAVRSFGGAAAKDDPLAALEAALVDIKPEPARAGPRLLDPNAKSWDLYHGSEPGSDFARFDPTKAGNPGERAVFFAPSAETASDYAGRPKAGAEAGARVFRATVEPGRTGVFDLSRLAETDPAFNARARELTVRDSGAAHGQTFDTYMDGFRASREQDRAIAAQAAEMGYEIGPDAASRLSHGHGHIGAAIERARAQGLDTAILRGLAEHGGDDQVVALTPGRVRSAYAPDELLYSGGPAGAAPGAAAAAAGMQASDSSRSSSGAKMAGLFDDVPDVPNASGNASVRVTKPAPAGLFDDVPDAKASDSSALSRAGSVAGDMAQSAGAGIIRGAAGMLDLPQNLYGLADHWIGEGVKRGFRAVGRAPQSDLGVDTRSQSLIPSPADLPKPGETAIRGLEAATGKLYEPQTRAGKFAQAAAEFVPGAGKRLGDVVAYGVLPGLASEGAGQLTEGSSSEMPARIGAAILTTLGGAAFRTAGRAEAQVARRTQGATAEQVDQAEALFREAAERGLPLTRANALDAVTKGVTSLGDLQRVVEGSGGLRGFFAPTADGVKREGQGVLDTIAPPVTQPAVLGGEVRDAARAAVAQTPQGQAVARAQDAVGPRVTPEEAGQAIQPALQRVYDRREGMRAALGEADYAAARNAPEGVGVERQVTVERPGEPVVTYPQGRPQFTDAAPRPLEAFQRPVAEAADAGPESLARFVARNGGLRLDGDVTATDLHRFNIPGLGNVARSGGKGIDDFWRESLIEHGYLKPDADGGAARDITSELLRKLQNEQRGLPSYPIGAERGGAGRSVSRQADEYAEALSTAEARLDQDLRAAGVPPESLHPDVRSRTLGAIMRGEEADPLAAYGRVVDGMREPPAPYVKSTTVAEQIPDVRFGQANPQAVVDHIDEALRTAKGPAAKALGDARKTLFMPGGRELDLSVEGLHNARDAIGDLIAKAEPAAQRSLLGVRDRLDRALGAVPEYEHARSGFEAASRNLDPFAEGTVPGRIAARDKVTGRSTMAPEKVPEAIAEGPTPARQFNEVAPPEARQAMEGRLATQVLDAVTDRPGATSAESIRAALRQHEDLFRQYPAVRDRLQAVAAAHDGIEAVNRSPLGKIANRPDAQAAIEALFPTGAKGVSAEEVGQAVRGLARNNARAAQDLVRLHVGQVFEDATTRLQSGPNQAAGPRFSQALVGHPGEGPSVEAAIRALPGGEETWKGVRRLLDIFDAQGARQAIGSGTTFNNAIEADLKAGKPVAEAGSAVITGGIKLPGRIMDRIEQWRLGSGLDELAQLFTDPKMASTFRRLATQPSGSEGFWRIAGMALERGARGYGTTQRAKPEADPDWKPLQFTVRPRP